jgi:hypothetical protein
MIPDFYSIPYLAGCRRNTEGWMQIIQKCPLLEILYE